jgi:hypothetical protein
MSDMTFSPNNMRKRFHDLGVTRNKKLAASAPLRTKRDAKIAAHDVEIAALNAQIKAAEAGLYDIDMERAALARALSGKTGEPPA